MRLLWEDRAREENLYWQSQDKKTLKELMHLLKIYKGIHFKESASLSHLKII